MQAEKHGLGSPEVIYRPQQGVKRHREGRRGWTVKVMHDRLRVVSTELPPRTYEPDDAPPKRGTVTLTTSPGPATADAPLGLSPL